MVCSLECALKLGEYNKKKAAAKALQVYKQSKLSYWKKRFQEKFNTYIRLRDKGHSCISCGRLQASAWHAGHYVAVGANSTIRYHEDNVHKQCSYCNTHKHSNAIKYRLNLIKKIGINRVEFLEGWHEPVKFTIQNLKELDKVYSLKIKELKKTRAITDND